MRVQLGSAAVVTVMLVILSVATGVVPAAAQGRLRETTGTTGVVEQPVDPTKLGVDLRRIRRELVRVTVREERDGNNLRYQVDVFGVLPPLELFFGSRNDPNFFTGPAPYGAPTHRDFLNLNTPEEHRAQPANVGNLFRWLADKARDKDTPKR